MPQLSKTCSNCNHHCHCSNGGSCRTNDCECRICEHNALDEFWRELGGYDAPDKKRHKN